MELNIANNYGFNSTVKIIKSSDFQQGSIVLIKTSETQYRKGRISQVKTYDVRCLDQNGDDIQDRQTKEFNILGSRYNYKTLKEATEYYKSII